MIYKFRKAGVFTNVTLYKRRVGGVWDDVDTGKFKKAVDGWTLYWDRLANKLRRPAEGTYSSMGAISFSPDGSIKIGPRYHDPITTSLGTWRDLALGTAPADVWDIYVEKYLDQGDLEPGSSAALNTWLSVYPGSTVRKWCANNGGAGACVLKITMRDQNANQVVWYAELTYGGTGTVSYDPIVWGETGGGGGGFPDEPF